MDSLAPGRPGKIFLSRSGIAFTGMFFFRGQTADADIAQEPRRSALDEGRLNRPTDERM